MMIFRESAGLPMTHATGGTLARLLRRARRARRARSGAGGARVTRALLFRVLAIVALLQPAAPTVAAVLDAWYDNGAPAVAHAESQSSTDCIRVHADNCALCSIVVAFQSAPPDVAPPHDTRTPHTVSADQVAIGSALVVPTLPPTRAPPSSART